MEDDLLASALSRIQEEEVKKLIEFYLLSGWDRMEIVQSLRLGMSKVTRIYEAGEYFLADLMMASEIFKDSIAVIKPRTRLETPSGAPTMVIGTVKNDIHDIGKNMTAEFFRCDGFEVIDLGVDVSADHFIEAVRTRNPQLLCLSGLVTASYESMRDTVRHLAAKGLRQGITIMIGGMVDESIKEYVSADYWMKDGLGGVHLCHSLFKPEQKEPMFLC
jgi:methanogenic corrinoid protein MtbC1